MVTGVLTASQLLIAPHHSPPKPKLVKIDETRQTPSAWPPNVMFTKIFLTLSALGLSSACFAAEPNSPAARKFPNLSYKSPANPACQLDLYVPEKAAAPTPLVVWVHGGGWRTGSRKQFPAPLLIPTGFAVATLDYRLTGEAPFPAQIEDVKAAIRWLRTHSTEYGIDPQHFGVIGHSAGGHLVSLLGVTNTPSSFDVGENLKVSSAVQAVCTMSGPSDFFSLAEGADEHRSHALIDLFGGTPSDKPALAKAASPTSYAAAGAPPFLIIHGENDTVVPLSQALTLQNHLEKGSGAVELLILPMTPRCV
jgi:acetyl esterase/lipase